MIARFRGYSLKVVMPASVGQERISLLEAFGAEIILSDGNMGTNESIVVAEGIAKENPSFYMPYQYGNEANPRAHVETTGPEILNDLPETDVFVAGLGTGGTLMGTGRALRKHKPKVRVVAVAPHPDDAVQGLRSLEHGFIPPILNLDELDGRLLVGAEESFFWTKELMHRFSLFVGVSSGAVIAGARKTACSMTRGTIVCLLADSGWKYLSSGLWTREFAEMKEDVAGRVWW